MPRKNIKITSFKIIFVAILTVNFFVSSNASAQIMDGFPNSSVDWDKVVKHTSREEAEGKELWEKLQAKEVACGDLNDEQFGMLGEYFIWG